MDSFINALARAQEPAWSKAQVGPSQESVPLKVSESTVSLSPVKLKARRVVSFDPTDNMTRSFDVLRNMCMRDVVLHSAGGAVFGIASPTSGSGTSTTAVNLAFSLARLQKGAVLLADLSNAAHPWWAALSNEGTGSIADKAGGVASLEVAGMSLYAASLRPVIEGYSGNEIKEALRRWIARIRREFNEVCIVLDLPPLLSDDRVGPMISEVDMVVLVLAVGKSTVAELETSKSYLHDAPKVQLVLNKAQTYDF